MEGGEGDGGGDGKQVERSFDSVSAQVVRLVRDARASSTTSVRDIEDICGHISVQERSLKSIVEVSLPCFMLNTNYLSCTAGQDINNGN